MPREDQDAPSAAADRRRIRIILALVAAGWLLALVLMGVAAVFWDHG